MNINQLAVITDEISQDFEHALDVAAEYGVKAVDLRKIWKKNIALFTDDELKRLKDALDKRNMKVIVITGPIGKCLLPGARLSKEQGDSIMRNPKYNVSLFDRLVEISDFFETPYIRIFSFVKLGLKDEKERWELMMDLLKPLVKKAEELGKILLLENDFGMCVGSIEQTKQFFTEMNSKAVKLILDPGNYWVEDEPTTPEAYEYFYENDLVYHIYIKDPQKKRPVIGASFKVVGEGKINYQALFKQAEKYGYKGYFALETHAIKNKEEISRKSLENMIKL